MAAAVLRNLHTSPPAGMRPYIVMFDSWRGEEVSRYDQTVSQLEIVEENRQRLLKYIDDQGLQSLVSGVAPGTAFGAVGVIMTPEAAKVIKHLDGVESVIRSY